MADITMSTDWGAKGAQLTGAQVQAFIKAQLTANASAAKTNADNIDSLTTKVTELTGRMADDKRQVLVWFRNQYGTNMWGSVDQCKNYTQAMGWYAQGIWIERDGLPPLIMSMEQISCPWSSGIGTGDIDGTTSDMTKLYSDYNGKTHTSIILTTSQIDSQTKDYGVTWCNRYSTIGATAGKWWLPSVGELMTIRKHASAINACLKEMGKTELSGLFASSNESNPTAFWSVPILHGSVATPQSTSKSTSQLTVAVTSI